MKLTMTTRRILLQHYGRECGYKHSGNSGNQGGYGYSTTVLALILKYHRGLAQQFRC